MVYYVNVISFQTQAQYVKDKGLGGAMIWSVETDDFLGICGAGKFPLLTAINSVLTGKTSGNEVTKILLLTVVFTL
jgi:chitinase